jgi:alkaline phosphatase
MSRNASSKNILIKNEVTHEIEKIVVYAPATDKAYIPYEVLSLI